jgi:hypothetical protein
MYWVRNLTIGCVGLAAASCAAIPPFHHYQYAKISDVLIATECELEYALRSILAQYPRYTWIRNQVVTASFTLNAVQVGDVGTEANLVIPITHGTFNLGFDAGIKGTNSRLTKITVDYETNKLDISRCHMSSLVGELGLKEWLVRSAIELKKADETPTAMNYSIEFVVLAVAGIEPGVGIAKLSGHQFGATGRLAGSREDTHRLDVAAAEIKRGRNVAETRQRLNVERQIFQLERLAPRLR